MRIVRYLAITAALLGAACGSTADIDSRAATRGASDGLAVAPATGAAGQQGAATAAGRSGQDAVGVAGGGAQSMPTVPGSGSTTGAGGGSVAAAPGELPATGQGFDEDTIRIGFLTWSDVNRAGTTVGYAVDYGDAEKIANAVAEDLNARGGIAGRTVEVVIYDYETADVLGNPAQGDEKACSRLTEDNPVYAVVAVTGILTEGLPACLSDHGIALIANNNIPFPASWWNDNQGWFFATASTVLEKLLPVWLDRAAANDYFTGWDTAVGGPSPTAPVKVGLLSTSDPAGQIFTAVATEKLAQLGHPPAVTYEIGSPFDQSGISSAVLRFRSEGVTHVVPDRLNLLLFPQSAESQRYRPRYAVATTHGPILLQTAAPPAQLRGALGVGFYPSLDVDNANDPGDPSPASERCREIQRAAGEDPTTRESWNGMAKTCEGFWYLAAAIEAGGLTATGVADGTRRLGRLDPVGAFAVSFEGGRPDGLAAVRDFGFIDDCECFRYLNDANRPL